MTETTLHETAVHTAPEHPTLTRVEQTIQAGVGMSLAAALFAGYLYLFHGGDVPRCAVLALIALAIGALLGVATGKLADVMFWSGIGVAFGYLAIVRADMFDWTGVYLWPIVGGLVGAAAALSRDGRLVRRMLWCMAIAFGLVAAYTFARFGVRLDMATDLVCAAIGGLLMGLGVDLVRRFQVHASVPRHCLALQLITAAILCHAVAISYFPWL